MRIRPDPLLTPVQGDEEELTRLLAESGVVERIRVDENGGGPCSRIADSQVLTFDSWSAPRPHSNCALKAAMAYGAEARYPKAATAYGAEACYLSVGSVHRTLEFLEGILKYYADQGSFRLCQRYPQNDQSEFPLVFCLLIID